MLWYRAQQCTTYRAHASFSIHQTSRCGLRSTSRIPSSPAMARPGNWHACGSPPGFSTTTTSPSQSINSSSMPRTSACVRGPERRRALRMPRSERLNCPALLALASGAGGMAAGSGSLRGRYGGSGMGNVVWRIGGESSRSRFDGAAMCGLSVKRAALSPEAVFSWCQSLIVERDSPFSRRRTQRFPSLSFRRQTFLDWIGLGADGDRVDSTR